MSQDVQQARIEPDKYAMRAIPLSTLERSGPCVAIAGDLDALPSFS